MHVKPMLVFFASNVAISIYFMLDTLMLGFLSSYEQVGLYTSSMKIVAIITGGIAAINAALIPRLAFNNQEKNHEANKELLQKVFDVNSLLIIPIAVGGCLIAPRFVPIFFGHEFTGSIVPMQILSFKMIAMVTNIFLSANVLMVLGYENKLLITVILTAIFSLIVNLALIPRYGAVGAAITALTAEYFEVLLQIFIVFRFTKIRINTKVTLISALFTVPFFILYYWCKVIEDNIIFLTTFVGICALLYLTLQRYWAKNYLIIQQMNLIINKIKQI
jgi:O-antigen/teichoic acid export membrane protein